MNRCAYVHARRKDKDIQRCHGLLSCFTHNEPCGYKIRLEIALGETLGDLYGALKCCKAEEFIGSEMMSMK